MTTDRTIRCADCATDFIFTASEAEFYASKGFTEPRRCADCRAVRRAGRAAAGIESGYRPGPGEREIFTAPCATCGREARLPFRPTGARPVYCSDCFRSAGG